ncbi:MAG: hypothetical protein AB8F78_00880 [Saprospiraceae bacterium]
MPFNLLLLPLLAGYILVHYSTWGRFYHEYLDRQRLLFHSALAGIVLLGISLGIRYFAIENGYGTFLNGLNPSPSEFKFFWTSIASLVLGLLLVAVNRFFADKAIARLRAVRQVGSDLEILLAEAYFSGQLLQLTLDNGKFYIAWIASQPSPRQTTHLRFIPIYSGYRSEEKKLIFTTSYEEMYKTLMEEGHQDPVAFSNVAMVVELRDLTTISIFDPKIYARFGANRGS